MNLLQNISTLKKQAIKCVPSVDSVEKHTRVSGSNIFPICTDINVCFKLCVFEHILICKLVFILHQYECNASLRRRCTINGKSDHASNNILNFEDSNMLSKSLSGISWNRLTAFHQLLQKLCLLIEIQNV